MAELPLPEKGQQISEHSDPPKASPGLPEPPPPAAPENAATIECVCGAPIKRVALPPDIARASGRDAFWNHIGGDIYCYEDDRQAMAEPLEVTNARA